MFTESLKILIIYIFVRDIISLKTSPFLKFLEIVLLLRQFHVSFLPILIHYSILFCNSKLNSRIILNSWKLTTDQILLIIFGQLFKLFELSKFWEQKTKVMEVHPSWIQSNLDIIAHQSSEGKIQEGIESFNDCEITTDLGVKTTKCKGN